MEWKPAVPVPVLQGSWIGLDQILQHWEADDALAAQVMERQHPNLVLGFVQADMPASEQHLASRLQNCKDRWIAFFSQAVVGLAGRRRDERLQAHVNRMDPVAQ